MGPRPRSGSCGQIIVGQYSGSLQAVRYRRNTGTAGDHPVRPGGVHWQVLLRFRKAIAFSLCLYNRGRPGYGLADTHSAGLVSPGGWRQVWILVQPSTQVLIALCATRYTSRDGDQRCSGGHRQTRLRVAAALGIQLEVDLVANLMALSRHKLLFEALVSELSFLQGRRRRRPVHLWRYNRSSEFARLLTQSASTAQPSFDRYGWRPRRSVLLGSPPSLWYAQARTGLNATGRGIMASLGSDPWFTSLTGVRQPTSLTRYLTNLGRSAFC